MPDKARFLGEVFYGAFPVMDRPCDPCRFCFAGATRLVNNLLVRNERFVLAIRGVAGMEAALVMVGAANVGRITSVFCPATTNSGRDFGQGRCEPPVPIRQGQEAGAFHLGSTVVLVLRSPRPLRPAVQVGQSLRMGEGLYEA